MDSFLAFTSGLGNIVFALVLLAALAVMPYRLWQRAQRNKLRDELEVMEDELDAWRSDRGGSKASRNYLHGAVPKYDPSKHD